ncbi:hypothetical protein Bca101_035853 [Brassica carinata]
MATQSHGCGSRRICFKPLVISGESSLHCADMANVLVFLSDLQTSRSTSTVRVQLLLLGSHFSGQSLGCLEKVSGGDGGGGSQHHDGTETDRKKKRYSVTLLNRFNDLNRVSRSVLIQMISRGTNLAGNWAQHERADNNALKAENDKIRCENIATRAALKHDICLNCEDPYFDEHKPRIENAHLRDELERKSTFASKYMGRPISSHLSTLHPMQISPHGQASYERHCFDCDGRIA